MSERERERGRGPMSLGGAILIAVVGLWGLFLRPLLMRYASEMAEVMGYAMHRLVRGRPSFALSTYLPYSASFLYNY
ncbi:TPA_asm: hypothetical protein HUJ06_000165 [Nelumbo nucifera]|uniref:Uncharacterized protein n=1 Tax=Nelumbo nucifera TaxID=4432 RepID=A0A822XFJ8_NELNU|nr:TPA_asm: hypothetical protein HUJ06_019251 [Nelumbo nucifera]DAD17789.1 TPA_asm: hypothetical protein HUJ06_019252 [Nelumbo nucifera]DAD49403.1 TPA_asm: hypothetical protein HUJ06_000165 [Nelumbo nucifera]